MREVKIAAVVVLVLLVVCLGAVLGVLIYQPQLVTPSVAAVEGPAILIDSPSRGDQVMVGHAVQVLATGYDPTRIARIQLWVDGQMVISQAAAFPEGMNPLSLVTTWVPETRGSHTLVVRGYNMDGVPGQASLVISVVERPEILAEMPEEGCAGVLLIAHQVEEGETLEVIAAQYEVTVEEILACNPALDPVTPLAPGETLMVPYLASPEDEESAPPGVELPAVELPPGVDEEQGEELPPPEQGPQPGEDPPFDGEEVSEISLDGGPPVTDPPRAVVEVEARDLGTDRPYFAGYCLVQLGDGEMEWVPSGDDLFLPPEGAAWWEIAAELGGVENSRTVPVYGDTLHVEMHCYAFRERTDAEPIYLGGVTRDHADLDWTGRLLEATSEAGDEGGWFMVRYRICPGTCYPERELPAPYLLGYGRIGGRPYLRWQWDGDPDTIDGWFKYRNGAYVASVQGGPTSRLTEADLNPPCGEVYRFQVSAHRGPLGHGIESPLSDPFQIPPTGPQSCAVRRVTLTLRYLSTYCIQADCPEPEPDCSNCRVVFWYGGVSANGERIMNGPPIVTDGSVTWSGPVLDSWSCTDSPECRRVQYRAGDLFQGRDTLVVDLAESEHLTVAMWLMDWDTDGQSLRICDGEGVWTSDDLVTWQNLNDAPGIVLSCKGGQAGSELAWLNYELEIQDLGP